MSTTFKPFEQVTATIATVMAINFGATTAADKQARATTALAVSQYLAALGTGDFATANTLLTTAIGTISNPGVALIAQQLMALATPFINAEGAALAALPLLGIEVEGMLGNTAAGMAAAAGAYLPAPATKS